MADTAVAITAGTGTNIDTRTEGTNGNHRQVIVVGDPATNAGVAPVDATAGLKVDLGVDNDITGTVTANLSATDNAVLDAIAASVDTIDSVDFATQTTLAEIKAKTDNIPAQGQALAAASLPVVLTAAQITTLTPPAAITGFATSAKQDTGNTSLATVAGAVLADDADFTATTTTGISAMGVYESTPTTVTDGDLGTVGITSGRRLKTSATIDAALPAGTNAIGKLAANSGVDIGDVTIDNASIAVTQSGTWDEVGINDSGNSITVDQATGTNLHMVVDSGTVTTVSTVTAVTAITNALPAGTNAIGKLAANSGVDIGDVDITSIAAGNNNIGDVDIASIAAGTNTIGKVAGVPSDIDINGANANHADKYYTNAGAVTDGIVWSPAAGKRWHVTTLYINVSAAATVTLEDDLAGGDVARWKGELAANSGVVLTYDKEHPFCSAEDAADLIITTSAGNVYVQAVGYEV